MIFRLPLARTDVRRHACTVALLMTGGLFAACDRQPISDGPPAGAEADWVRDSTLLAARPAVLLRVVRRNGATQVAPIATIGVDGARVMRMGDRGWRAFDLAYLQQGSQVHPTREGRALAPVRMTRGMWEGAPLDTIAGCAVQVPFAAVPLPDGVELATVGAGPPTITSGTEGSGLSAAALAEVAEGVDKLVVPTTGIPLAELPRYRRRVQALRTTREGPPTVVISYRDPDGSPQTGPQVGQRPRQLIVVLDKSVYGYKPTYTFTDISATRADMPRRFLGGMDVNADGTAELFFGLEDPLYPLVTFVLRRGEDSWSDWWRYEYQPCHAIRG